LTECIWSLKKIYHFPSSVQSPIAKAGPRFRYIGRELIFLSIDIQIIYFLLGEIDANVPSTLLNIPMDVGF